MSMSGNGHFHNWGEVVVSLNDGHQTRLASYSLARTYQPVSNPEGVHPGGVSVRYYQRNAWTNFRGEYINEELGNENWQDVSGDTLEAFEELAFVAPAITSDPRWPLPTGYYAEDHPLPTDWIYVQLTAVANAHNYLETSRLRLVSR